MPRPLRLLAPLSLGLFLAPTLALAQGALQLPAAQPQAEQELPDVAAIERGARTRASVSFGGPTINEPSAESPAGQAPGPDGARSSDNIRRISAPQVETPGGRAGIYGMDSGPGGITSTSRPGQLPELHQVKAGDTLSSVCEQYFGDPFCWPRLWSENPQVTNPHWIFPGDVIRLRSASAPAPVARATGSGMQVTSNRRGSLDSKSVLLRETGFIDSEAFAESARITGSREEKIMLASNDQAYLGFPKDKPLRAGERYSVFVADTQNPVRAPDTGAILGYLVRVYGDVTVEQVTEGNVARGTLRELSEPVERGYAVSPKVRLFKQFAPKPSAVNAEARIVASFSPTLLLAAENFVVLSRGAKDGLQVGNRTFIIRRGDGYRPVMEGWQKPDNRFPKEVVAELWIVDVRQNASVAWVARSTKELRVGEVAELRKGH